jgi:hypothetical protein
MLAVEIELAGGSEILIAAFSWPIDIEGSG